MSAKQVRGRTMANPCKPSRARATVRAAAKLHARMLCEPFACHLAASAQNRLKQEDRSSL
eukprot:3276705-Pleurochrysis_carterae.AAC.2